MDRDTCAGPTVIKASIDIGTNTVLLLVAERVSDQLHVIEEQQQIPRLGRGVDKNRNLSKEAMDRVVEVLVGYQKLLTKRYPEVTDPIVTATSAVRDANNRAVFQERVKTETGLAVQILSGTEEAEYTFKGAQSMLSSKFSDKPLLALDIGGGSTEIALGKREKILDRYSFDIGCVRFTERFLGDAVVTEDHIAACRKAVQDMLTQHPFKVVPSVKLVGVSGTVTSLAYMDQELEEFENENIDGYSLSEQTIAQFIKWVRSVSTEELLNRYPVVMEGRADIFLAGLLILKGIMDHYAFDAITVSTGSIRHGAIMLAS